MKLLCLGDGGADHVAVIRARLPRLTVVTAPLARVGAAAAERPDVVTVLAARTRPGPLHADAYCALLCRVTTRLLAETDARIALIPPPGTDALAVEWADITREVAVEHDVAYLPARGALLADLIAGFALAPAPSARVPAPTINR